MSPTSTPLPLLLGATSAAGCSLRNKPGWSLIWCHERCHKPESEAFRSEVSAHVEKAHGTFVRFKKACGFSKWLADDPTVPWVLLTDWREAKPCLQILEESSSGQPAMFLVHTEGEKQHKRASCWCQELPREVRSKVEILPPAVTPNALVSLALLRLKRPELRPEPMTQHVQLNLSELLREEESVRLQKGMCSAETLQLTFLPVVPLTVAPGASLLPGSTAFYATRAGAWGRPVAEVMAPVVSSASSAEVEKMLIVAMPGCYED